MKEALSVKEITISAAPMTIEDLIAIARGRAPVRLTEDSKVRIIQARKLVEQWVEEGRIIYGITTGFGALSDVRISKAQARQLQQNILMSHASGGKTWKRKSWAVGLRVNDFARGHSGSGSALRSF
jgi:histidine ammonia-lyase